MKKIFLPVLIITLLFIFNFNTSAIEKKTLDYVKKLNDQKEYKKVIELLNKELLKNDSSIKLLNAKADALLNLKRYEEALKVRIDSYNLNPRKSPWRSMEIVSICLKLKNKEEAFRWLETAVK